MKTNQTRLHFFSALFSIDTFYPFIKIIFDLLTVLSDYYIVLTLCFLLNDIIYSFGIKIIIRDVAIISLLYFIIKIILSALNTSIVNRKTKLLEYDRNRKNSLFSKMPLYEYEGEEVQKLISNLKYLEMNGSTALTKLMDSPLTIISFSIALIIEVSFSTVLFKTINIEEIVVSILFCIIYVSMFTIASKIKAKYMQKGVSSFSNEGHKKLRKIASHIDYQYDVKVNPDIRYYNKKLLKEGGEEECEISKGIFSSYWNNIAKGSFYSTLFKTISFLIGLSFVTYNAIKGRIRIGSIFVFSTLLEKITMHIEKVLLQCNVLKAGDNYYLKRKKLEDISDTSIDTALKTVIKNWEKIEFVDISYSYPNKEEKIFDKFNIVLKRNESTALVGLNGSGKSTFIQLLLKFRKPDSGKILLDGRDIWSIDDKEYRSLFSPLLQDSSVFSFSFRDNLFLHEEKENELETLLRLFNLSHLDLEKDVGKDGKVELSGGQERKILFIRTLIHSDRYMILDEPSSASDFECETNIFKQLETKNNYLLITHNIRKLENISRIVVRKDGKLVADGKWNELIQHEGLIKELLECERRLYDERKD